MNAEIAALILSAKNTIAKADAQRRRGAGDVACQLESLAGDKIKRLRKLSGSEPAVAFEINKLVASITVNRNRNKARSWT